jgi:hypothetical protein
MAKIASSILAEPTSASISHSARALHDERLFVFGEMEDFNLFSKPFAPLS